MNTVVAYVREHGARIAGAYTSLLGPLSCVVLTPRFRASRHAVFLLIPAGERRPHFVAKLARLAGDRGPGRKEAENLRAAHAASPSGFDSIPRLVACEEYRQHNILLETALPGVRIGPDSMRRQLRRNVEDVCSWLGEFQAAHGLVAARVASGGGAILDASLERVERALLPSGGCASNLERTRLATDAVRSELPTTFEHGDLSHPNLLRDPEGGIRVLDWELAEPHGLPATDLFFFLSFAAFSRRRASSRAAQLGALHDAFFNRDAWARGLSRAYARRIGLEQELLRPLFLVCWVRCLAGLVERLSGSAQAHSGAGAWLRRHRFFEFWEYTLDHWEELRL